MSTTKKAKFVIAPFKQQVKIDPNFAEKTWATLKEAIGEIFKHNASGLSFEELYRKAYNLVLHKYGEMLYDGLYKTVREQLNTVQVELANCNDDRLLTDLNKKWQDHKLSMTMIRDILMYMDRTYVMTQKKTPVYELGLEVFRDVVTRAERIQSRVLHLILSLIHKERTMEMVDRPLLKQVMQMFVELGRETVYVEDFESYFLAESCNFYQIESQQFIASNSCPDYLKKAEARIKEETARVAHYLDPSTEPKIRNTVETELIAKHMRHLVEMENSGLVAMLKDDKIEDLARMYDLFRRVPQGLNTMRDVLGTHLRAVGKAVVTDEERLKDPVAFVTSLLELKDKHDRVIQQAFGNDKSFQNTLNQAFEHFINLNNRSPEYISLYVDDKLRKGLKGVSEEEVETTLDKVMMLFRYLQEKDVFDKYYKQHLAKRLLTGRSVSDDAERSLISKLKTECGYQFTSKLEGMFNDMRLSHDAMDQFQAHRANASAQGQGDLLQGVELQVHVLTTGFWPSQAAPQCTLPQEIVRCCEEFAKFYHTAHTGRRLTWQTNMGTADLRAYFDTKRHELTVNTYQMCILLLFNSAERLSYGEIKQATGIQPADLKRNLQSLACAKYRVLNKEPKGKDVAETDSFSFNGGFQCKLFRVKIGTVSAQKETESEKQETRQKVDEDRKPQIEAAIVRVMKSRKTMEHSALVAEVTKQLQARMLGLGLGARPRAAAPSPKSPRGPLGAPPPLAQRRLTGQRRFLPNPTIIKKRIESLIEREFLERAGEGGRTYRYLA
eukprot:tig00020934_g16100.t1